MTEAAMSANTGFTRETNDPETLAGAKPYGYSEEPRYKRILLKLSGEALAGDTAHGEGARGYPRGGHGQSLFQHRYGICPARPGAWRRRYPDGKEPRGRRVFRRPIPQPRSHQVRGIELPPGPGNGPARYG